MQRVLGPGFAVTSLERLEDKGFDLVGVGWVVDVPEGGHSGRCLAHPLHTSHVALGGRQHVGDVVATISAGVNAPLEAVAHAVLHVVGGAGVAAPEPRPQVDPHKAVGQSAPKVEEAVPVGVVAQRQVAHNILELSRRKLRKLVLAHRPVVPQPQNSARGRRFIANGGGASTGRLGAQPLEESAQCLAARDGAARLGTLRVVAVVGQAGEALRPPEVSIQTLGQAGQQDWLAVAPGELEQPQAGPGGRRHVVVQPKQAAVAEPGVLGVVRSWVLVRRGDAHRRVVQGAPGVVVGRANQVAQVRRVRVLKKEEFVIII